jgi:hypothetical protein
MLTEKEALKKSFVEWISQYPFEWFVTLTFYREIKQSKAIIECKKWMLRLCRGEHLQIGSIGVINGKHIHLLMLGRNSNNKTLKTVTTDFWCDNWSKYKAGAKIEPIYRLEGASAYVAGNLYSSDKHSGASAYVAKNLDLSGKYSDIIDYNKDLLIKVRDNKPIDKDIVQKNTVKVPKKNKRVYTLHKPDDIDYKTFENVAIEDVA